MANETTAATAPPQIEPAIRTIAMPADANANGDIFGGWLLSQMDLAGASVAGRRARSRVATVAITGMSFRRPVYIGDEITCYASITKVGHTSLTVKVESWVRRSRGFEDKQAIEVTEGIFTYVAISADGTPRAVPAEG
jgi:acyl-CoA thioesterase YciA